MLEERDHFATSQSSLHRLRARKSADGLPPRAGLSITLLGRHCDRQGGPWLCRSLGEHTEKDWLCGLLHGTSLQGTGDPGGMPGRSARLSLRLHVHTGATCGGCTTQAGPLAGPWGLRLLERTFCRRLACTLPGVKGMRVGRG